MGDQAVAHGVPPGPGDALTEEPNQGLGTAIPMSLTTHVKDTDKPITDTLAVPLSTVARRRPRGDSRHGPNGPCDRDA